VIVEQTTAIQKLREEVFQLRAERDALRKDAARLDWLERHSLYIALDFRVYDSSDQSSGTIGSDRDAIDAAMAVQPTTEGTP
jgi:hypothetical protein